VAPIIPILVLVLLLVTCFVGTIVCSSVVVLTVGLGGINIPESPSKIQHKEIFLIYQKKNTSHKCINE